MANLRFSIHNDIKLLVKCHGDFEVQTLEEKAVHFSRRVCKEKVKPKFEKAEKNLNAGK